MKRKKILKGLSIAILGTVAVASAVCVGIALQYKLTHKDLSCDDILYRKEND